MDDRTPLIDRDRGVFTRADREILLKDTVESGSQQERNVRMRLRNRLENSLIDFAIALEEMEHRDLEKVINGERSAEEQQRLDVGIESVIGFIHWATDRNTPPRDFKTLLERGIRRSVAARHRDADDTIRGYVDVDFEVHEETHNIDDLYRRFQNPHTEDMLTMAELGMLRKEEMITGEDIGRYHEETLDSTIQERGAGFVSRDELGDVLDEGHDKDE